MKDKELFNKIIEECQLYSPNQKKILKCLNSIEIENSIIAHMSYLTKISNIPHSSTYNAMKGLMIDGIIVKDVVQNNTYHFNLSKVKMIEEDYNNKISS